MDANWYEGERNAMIGILPISYVEIIPAMDSNTLQSSRPKSAGAGGQHQDGQAKAKFNFQSQTPMELSLIKGNYFGK